MKKQVLFVDDDPGILQAMKRVMRSLRTILDTSFAESAQDALNMMAEQPFDIVISDMRMPGMDGADLLNEVRLRHPHMTRIVLSGHSDEGMILRSIGAAHQYLAKPCSPEVVKATIDRACAIQDILSDSKLKELVSGLSSLPCLPDVYHQLLEELNKEDGSIDRIGEIISTDAGLCAKLLQLVNSAFFGLPRSIANPADAVKHLGFETIKTLVLVVKVFDSFPARSTRYFCLDTHWHHGTSTGALANYLAKQEGLDATGVEQAMTGGMLHDIGKLVLANQLPDVFEQICKIQAQEHLTSLQAEERVIGTTHAHIGGYLLGTWGLLPELVEAVIYHHTPLRHPVTHFTPLTAVYLANVFTHAARDGTPLTDVVIDEPYLQQIGKLDQFPRWCEMSHTFFHEAASTT